MHLFYTHARMRAHAHVLHVPKWWRVCTSLWHGLCTHLCIGSHTCLYMVDAHVRIRVHTHACMRPFGDALCTCPYACPYAHPYARPYTGPYTCPHTFIWTRIWTCICACILTWIWTWTCATIFTCILTCIQTCIWTCYMGMHMCARPEHFRQMQGMCMDMYYIT